MYRICQIAKTLGKYSSHIGAGEPVFKVSARYVINVELLEVSIDTSPCLMIEERGAPTVHRLQCP
jgi:hypothetical protein